MTAVKWPVKKIVEKIVKMAGMFLGSYYANISIKFICTCIYCKGLNQI